jgi:hypothetical protein
MPAIGHRATWLIAGALVAAVPALFMWGFTVDDALISVRYAGHVVQGVGWRFDAGGPATDGVTPLPWPVVLAPMAWGDALVVLGRAKVLGFVAWVAAGGALGTAIGARREATAGTEASSEGRPVPRLVWDAAALGVLALSVPVAAHAVSGMETALATSLATLAAVSARRPWRVAVLAGAAAAFRPEMAPWACVLAAGASIVARPGTGRAVGAAAVALAPFAACAAVRVAVWGRPSPLALLAKPSDVDHGLAYAGAALVVTLVPLLVVAPIALRRAPEAAIVVAAAAAHVLAVVAVGGDWMPYARLMVPVVPSLAWAAVLVAERAHPVASGVRSVAAVALGVVLVARGGTDGRHVGADRAALVEVAKPVFARAAHVASLDVGWVGAATEGDIVDLAGVTDPAIAALPGGHTSKRVDARLLLDRGVDVLLLYLPAGLPDGDLARWREGPYERFVEGRLAADDVLARHFVADRWLPLGARGAGYVLLRARSGE